MRQGIEIKLLTAPKETLIPHSLVPPTILSLKALSSVTKLSTAPAPVAWPQWTSNFGWLFNPG